MHVVYKRESSADCASVFCAAPYSLRGKIRMEVSSVSISVHPAVSKLMHNWHVTHLLCQILRMHPGISLWNVRGISSYVCSYTQDPMAALMLWKAVDTIKPYFAAQALNALAEVAHGACGKASRLKRFNGANYEELKLYAQATIMNFDPKALVKLQETLKRQSSNYYRPAGTTKRTLTQKLHGMKM
eukprot:5108867-Amphidinium_carterae.1